MSKNEKHLFQNVLSIKERNVSRDSNPQSLMNPNYEALWPTNTHCISLERSWTRLLIYYLLKSSILEICFALSKWPHLHRAYTIGEYIFFCCNLPETQFPLLSVESPTSQTHILSVVSQILLSAQCLLSVHAKSKNVKNINCVNRQWRPVLSRQGPLYEAKLGFLPVP